MAPEACHPEYTGAIVDIGSWVELYRHVLDNDIYGPHIVFLAHRRVIRIVEVERLRSRILDVLQQGLQNRPDIHAKLKSLPSQNRVWSIGREWT